MRKEFDRFGIPYRGIDPRIIEREEREYDLADAIFVPSRFVLRSFVQMGVAEGKLRVLPYGVDLTRFSRVALPAADSFDVLFVGALSVRKGAHYLLRAFERLVHPRKSLTLAGTIAPEVHAAVQGLLARQPGVRLLGHVPQDQLKAIMSRAHVLALPSIEEGLALVQAQAMACGCPVVASRNTGAEDLFSDGFEGTIVPPGNLDALCAALQELADDPDLRNRMAIAAQARVARSGGWNEYGRAALEAFSSFVDR